MVEVLTQAQPETGKRVHTKKAQPDRLARWVEHAGYENSAVWCRNIHELIGAITHGVMAPAIRNSALVLEDAISQEDALTIVTRLIILGRAEVIPLQDGSVTWNIHHRGTDDPAFHFTTP